MNKEFFTMAGGIPVHVSDTQTGTKVLVLLHGYLETLAIWDDFTALLDKDIRVIRLDLPGHGLSGTNHDINTVDFSAQVVYETMLKCGASECVIAGHSMGGYTALAFAANYPKATCGLCLFHSTPNPDPEEKQDGRNREIALLREGKLTLAIAKGIPRMFAADNTVRFAAKIAEIKEVAEICEPEGVIACLEGMKARPDRNAFLSEFTKPLLFIFGEKDRYISKETAQGLAERYKQAQVLWLADSGHNGFIEEPIKVAEKVNEFMALCKKV
ncbi:MAG: alpha/beta hydrolase [Bacteroidales bacterium]|nr:alpha/beta hydrolase [Bacteroidales bacterium]